jgi:hypothetical protein
MVPFVGLKAPVTGRRWCKGFSDLPVVEQEMVVNREEEVHETLLLRPTYHLRRIVQECGFLFSSNIHFRPVLLCFDGLVEE